MTPEEIIADIRSDRIKKMIVDTDTGADGDDQFAFALALRATDRIKVLSVNSEPFNDDSADMAAAGQAENATIARLANPDAPVPSYCGCGDFISRVGTPIMSPAVQNIIDTCRNSDEPVYIVMSGCCTNAASALALAPDIAEKLIVVWLALDNLENRSNTGEYNYHNDIEAGKLLFALAKNMVLCVAGKLVAPFYRTNDQIDEMFGHGDELCRWLARRFREISWAQGLWDYCAEGIFVCPDAFSFEVSSVPTFREDGEIEDFDHTRKMVAVTSVDHRMLIDCALKVMGVK